MRRDGTISRSSSFVRSGVRPPRLPGAEPPPRKRLGQHFLTDPRILGRIADALALTGSETVIEIGAGRGALTEVLEKRCARLYAVELDRALAPMLRTRFADRPHVTIVEADIRDVSPGELAGGPYLVIGNVPYYITTPIVFHVLRRPWPLRAVFLVQREVAERMGAGAGDDGYGALSVNVQVIARVEMLVRVAPGAFTPPPTVESALVRLTPLDEPLVTEAEQDEFRRFVQAVFANRRKQLRTIIRSIASVAATEADRLITSVGLAPDVRPERVTPAEFVRLWRAIRPASTHT